MPTGTPAPLSALERLATFAGVLTEFEDVFGKMRACPERSIRAILGAMGFDVATEEAAAKSLRGAEAVTWQRLLEPVYVVASESRPRLTISLAAESAEMLTWTIVAEDGTEADGAIRADALPVAATATVDGRTYVRCELELPAALAQGYYSFTLRERAREQTATIASVPESCYLPDLGPRGVWGLAVQLYALRSERGAGIGDFTDLAALCATVARAGGAVVGLNPLHELTFARDAVPSPYSPSSRTFLNWIYLDVAALPGYDGAQAPAGARAGPGELIDYAAVAASKRRAARAAYRRFYENDIVPGASGEALAFRAFVREGGTALRSATTFNVLSEHFARGAGVATQWQSWPLEFRDPGSASVARFVDEHARDVEFFAYLQWQADVQLAAAAGAGLRVGLYRDLAVGAELSGADSWASQTTLRSTVTVGAPPDVLNRRGQAWGVAPFDPLALREAAYAPFVALLRANMRHAGALRIDHVMALARLYWVPQDAEPGDGAYVSYRLDDLLGLIALESRRARCMVIGEDLGTVPDGFRERLSRARLLSYRLLEFEQDDERFFAPEEYPELALVATGTHDLPPIGAYWTARDIDVRCALGLCGDAAAVRHEREERATKRARLLAALCEAGLPEDDAARFERTAAHPEDRNTLAEIGLWANRYLARSPCRLLMVQLEDLLGEVEQVNVPTTTAEHPNWRRRASVDVGEIASDPRFVALAATLESEGRA